MRENTEQDEMRICKTIEALAKKEAEKYKARQYDFRDRVYIGVCEAIIKEIGIKGSDVVCAEEHLAMRMYYNKGVQFFEEDGVDSQIILQNMGEVAEFVSELVQDDSKREQYFKGDYVLADVVSGIVAQEIYAYHLFAPHFFNSNYCLSTRCACIVLDALGFSSYKDYGVTWRDSRGFYKDGRNENGTKYDEYGYDCKGYNKDGYNNAGYDVYGDKRYRGW